MVNDKIVDVAGAGLLELDLDDVRVCEEHLRAVEPGEQVLVAVAGETRPARTRPGRAATHARSASW